MEHPFLCDVPRPTKTRISSKRRSDAGEEIRKKKVKSGSFWVGSWGPFIAYIYKRLLERKFAREGEVGHKTCKIEYYAGGGEDVKGRRGLETDKSSNTGGRSQIGADRKYLVIYEELSSRIVYRAPKRRRLTGRSSTFSKRGG